MDREQQAREPPHPRKEATQSERERHQGLSPQQQRNPWEEMEETPLRAAVEPQHSQEESAQRQREEQQEPQERRFVEPHRDLAQPTSSLWPIPH